MTKEAKQLFWIWCAFRHRCYKPSSRQWKDYGGRGIKVCDQWLGRWGFVYFLADMWPRPQGALLERTDNNGDYTPENCRWATRKEQNSNRRYCIYVNGITLKEYCRQNGLKYRPIHKRIRLRGWPIDLAISTPLGTWRKGSEAA